MRHIRKCPPQAAGHWHRSRLRLIGGLASAVALLAYWPAGLLQAQEAREASGLFGPAREAAQSAAAQASRAARTLLDPPVLSVAASASREVANDRMIVVLYVEEEAADAGQAQSEANARISGVLETLRQTDQKLEIETHWRTWPVDVDGRIRSWRTRASLRIQGAVSPALSGLIGQLTGSLGIESVRHELSRAARERVEADLLTEVARRFQDQARAAALALGYRETTIRAINLNQSSSGTPLVMARMAASPGAASGGPLSSAEGTSTVTLTLEGSVWLSR